MFNIRKVYIKLHELQNMTQKENKDICVGLKAAENIIAAEFGDFGIIDTTDYEQAQNRIGGAI